jgi:hypothetical protein
MSSRVPRPGLLPSLDRSRNSTPVCGPRDEANGGASHPGAQDRRHHSDRLEERSRFRRGTSETAGSLSVWEESIPRFVSAMASWFSRRSGSTLSIHNPVRHVLRALSLSRNPMPPRTTRKSDRRKVPDRTVVGTAQPVCLSASEMNGRRHESAMNLQRRAIHRLSFHCFYRTGLSETGNPLHEV